MICMTVACGNPYRSAECWHQSGNLHGRTRPRELSSHSFCLLLMRVKQKPENAHYSLEMDQRRAIRVFLVEPSRALRQRMSAALAKHHIHVIGESATVDESVAAILQLQPDVVVLEVALHDGSGLQVMKHVQTVCPGIQFVVYTNDVERQYRERYLRSGARAFLNKTAETEQLPSAIAAACRPGRLLGVSHPQLF